MELRQTIPKTTKRSLKGIALFDGVDEGFLRDLEVRCHWRSFAASQQIVSHLDGSDDVFSPLLGRARAIIYSPLDKAIVFRDIGPGLQRMRSEPTIECFS